MNMKLGRRKFLKVAGLGGAAAPFAAKAALEKETLALTASNNGALAGAAFGLASPPTDSATELGVRTKMANHIKLFGIPDHILKKVKEESKWVYSLDFDIANKRSWSLAAKVHEQRQRNLKRRLDRLYGGGMLASARQAFAKTFGFEFLDW